MNAFAAWLLDLMKLDISDDVVTEHNVLSIVNFVVEKPLDLCRVHAARLINNTSRRFF